MKIIKKVVILIFIMVFVTLSGIFTHNYITSDEEITIRKALDQRSDQMAIDAKREIYRYETVISTMATLFNSSDTVTKDQFTAFTNGLNLGNSYPGIKGLVYVLKVGSNDAQEVNDKSAEIGSPLKSPITLDGTEKAILYYVIPADDEQVPTGLDANLIPGGKEGFQYSINSNSAGASPPLKYVIDSKPTTGFALIYPVKGGAPIHLDSMKSSPNTGWILSFIDSSLLFDTPLGRDFSLEITDHNDPQLKSEIKIDNPSNYSTNYSIDVGGRKLDFKATASKSFIESVSPEAKARKYTLFVLNAEIAIILLILILFMQKSKKSNETSLGHQITHDTLTGLPNRLFLENWMNNRISNITNSPRNKNNDRIAVLFLDLDGFKAINDTLGHQAGDRFLISVSQRLSNEIRGHDILARLGGDEFIVVLDSVDQEIQAIRIAERLLEVVRFPVVLDSGPVCVSASIGIAISTLEVGIDPDSIIRFADSAMYAAKQDIHNRIRVFDNKLKSIVEGKHEVETSILHATERGEIIDVLQPIVNVKTGETAGYEALCRWNNPNFGVLGPDQFLDAAKVTGEIIRIDSWMVDKAFTNALEISEITGVPCRVWVNLSVRHLLQGDFYKHVLDVLKNSSAKADMIGVEIEESVFKVDSGLLYPFLNQLRDLGIPVGLDDFGAEEASLQALKKYDYDVIKLGRNLINDFITNPSTSIIPAVIQLAKASDTKVVATGVETPEALQKIINAGCDFVQGYVFSKPQEIEALVDVSPNFVWQLPLGVKSKVTNTDNTDDNGVSSILDKQSS